MSNMFFAALPLLPVFATAFRLNRSRVRRLLNSGFSGGRLNGVLFWLLRSLALNGRSTSGKSAMSIGQSVPILCRNG